MILAHKSGIMISVVGDDTMESNRIKPPAPESQKQQSPGALDHVAGAHHLLQSLQEQIGEHPELREAITRLEMALSILTVQTGGML